MANAVKKAAVEMAKDQAMAKLEQGQKVVEKEIGKIKKQFDGALKSVESFAKKNPEKAALITAGVGAAVGAALAMLLKGKKGKK